MRKVILFVQVMTSSKGRDLARHGRSGLFEEAHLGGMEHHLAREVVPAEVEELKRRSRGDLVVGRRAGSGLHGSGPDRRVPDLLHPDREGKRLFPSSSEKVLRRLAEPRVLGTGSSFSGTNGFG